MNRPYSPLHAPGSAGIFADVSAAAVRRLGRLRSRDAKRTTFAAGKILARITVAGLVLVTAGCQTVGVQSQRLVSKPNMQFSQRVVYSYASKIGPQIQPGLMASGGAQASVCTSCR